MSETLPRTLGGIEIPNDWEDYSLFAKFHWAFHNKAYASLKVEKEVDSSDGPRWAQVKNYARLFNEESFCEFFGPGHYRLSVFQPGGKYFLKEQFYTVGSRPRDLPSDIPSATAVPTPTPTATSDIEGLMQQCAALHVDFSKVLPFKSDLLAGRVSLLSILPFLKSPPLPEAVVGQQASSTPNAGYITPEQLREERKRWEEEAAERERRTKAETELESTRRELREMKESLDSRLAEAREAKSLQNDPTFVEKMFGILTTQKQVETRQLDPLAMVKEIDSVVKDRMHLVQPNPGSGAAEVVTAITSGVAPAFELLAAIYGENAKINAETNKMRVQFELEEKREKTSLSRQLALEKARKEAEYQRLLANLSPRERTSLLMAQHAGLTPAVQGLPSVEFEDDEAGEAVGDVLHPEDDQESELDVNAIKEPMGTIGVYLMNLVRNPPADLTTSGSVDLSLNHLYQLGGEAAINALDVELREIADNELADDIEVAKMIGWLKGKLPLVARVKIKYATESEAAKREILGFVSELRRFIAALSDGDDDAIVRLHSIMELHLSGVDD